MPSLGRILSVIAVIVGAIFTYQLNRPIVAVTRPDKGSEKGYYIQTGQFDVGCSASFKMPFENRGNLTATDLIISHKVEGVRILGQGQLPQRAMDDTSEYLIGDLAPKDVYTYAVLQLFGPPGGDCSLFHDANEDGMLAIRVRYDVSYGSIIPFLRHTMFIVVEFRSDNALHVSTGRSVF